MTTNLEETTAIGNRSVYYELVRYATLAASSHNTQCWQFKLADRKISILPDLTRRCPAVDPDNHNLYASLGCATENLLIAAKTHGFEGTVELQTEEATVKAIHIHLAKCSPVHSSLFDAIAERQCARSIYDGQPLKDEALELLKRAGTGERVSLILLTQKQALEAVRAYITEGNTAQINEPAFVKELKSWIRFNLAEAVKKGDGLFSKSTGNPTAPHWLGSLLFDVAFSAKLENKKIAKQVRSSAGIAIFVSDKNDPTHWIESGRCYQRFALQAEALDIRTAFLNQPVEVATLRSQFANYLGIGERRPDLVVRFGHGPKMPRSFRRPVEAVIV
ncbi:MAG: Tat pathway signal protein [Cyanobacteria bacterium J06621_11]